MQKFTSAALVFAVLLGGVAAWQTSALNASARKISALEQKLREQEAALKTARESAATLTQQKQWLDQESQTLRKKIAAVTSTQPAPVPVQDARPKKGGIKIFLTKMMSDPGMREAMRRQQRAMLPMMYAGVGKDMGLTEEQTEKLMDMLADRQMKMTEAAGAVLGGDASDKQQTAQGMADAQKTADEDIKTYLGDANYKKLENWEGGMQARMQMNQVKQTFAGSAAPLQEFQSTQLSQIMQEESLRPSPQFDASEAVRARKDPTFFSNPENVDRTIARITEINQRVVDRARGILSPDQLKTLQNSQNQQLEMQKFGMKMASQFFGGGDNAEAQNPPAQ